jgi:tetratricopeptide (TPR) repeat protein
MQKKQLNPSEELQHAVQLHKEGKLDQAELRYIAILKAQPNHFDALHFLGILRSQRGRHAEGLDHIRAALKLKPTDASALSNFGLILRGLRRPEEALASFDKALAIKPDHADALNNRGNALRDLKRPAEALASYDKALAIRPDYAEALYNRGDALKDLKRPAEAVGSYDKALAIKPDYADALNNRGVALTDLKRPAEALASYDKALAIKPDYADALNNRGNALKDLKRPEEALASYDKVLAIKADHADALNNRGNALKDLKRPAEALASYDKALAIRPDYVEALYNRGSTVLLMGDFPAGWSGYEQRWYRRDASPRTFIAPNPVWKGEDIQGKHIVVYEEQGLGDTIHFSRFLTRLSSLGASVTFLVRSSMHRLLQPFASTIRLTDKPLQGESFDFQCALLSLPAAFGTTLETVPSDIPYLIAEALLVAHWRQRIGGHGFKIGICWQGNPAAKIDFGRSVPLRCFHPIAAIPGVRLISIQKHHGLDQLSDLPSGMTIENLGAEFDSGPDAFVDTAAVMSCLDLIITSDTSVAHLAGALGRPVWVVLKYVPDWRWMLDRSDSPWYPTMKLYRQTVRDDWTGVFDRVAGDVAKLNVAAGELQHAVQLHKAGKLDQAELRYIAILKAQPNHFDALHFLGILRSQQGRHSEGLDHIRAALKLQPTEASALYNLGLVLKRMGRPEEALASFDNALAALNNRGLALRDLKRPEEALASFDNALAIRPDDVGALNNRGVALRDLKRAEEALASFDKALAARPDCVEALNNRGLALQDLKRPEEALASYDKALAIRPDYVETICNRGVALKDLKRPEEALASYDNALAIKPDFAEALSDRGRSALLMGDFRVGWSGYEHRWDVKDAPPRQLIAPYPAWKGENIQGKRIIVYDEQGSGDVIQFSRFLTRLSSLGASVTFLVRSSMHRLLQPFASTIRLTDKPPQGESFDFQCALLSLPAAFGTTLETVPSDIPYLIPEAPLVARWRQRIGGHGFKIGICWQGKPVAKIDFGRSVPLRCFHPIAAIPGVRLISIQKHHGLDQLSGLPSGMTIENLGAEFDSGLAAFVDTAAVMSCLDLIITSDTSVAHLAGALGRPVWVVLKYVPDWRWMLDRADSPWYPTMKLYRQTVRDDWGGVFDRVAGDSARLSAAPKPESATLLQIPGSIGELFDKITILEIKAARINDSEKLRNVAHELALLRTLESQCCLSDHQARLVAELKRINETLWDIEDAIRDCERRREFGAEFISLARSVYTTNDHRAAVKRQINMLHNSAIVEEKSYPSQS